jgi:hypothetical protein
MKKAKNSLLNLIVLLLLTLSLNAQTCDNPINISGWDPYNNTAVYIMKMSANNQRLCTITPNDIYVRVYNIDPTPTITP